MLLNHVDAPLSFVDGEGNKSGGATIREREVHTVPLFANR
jgi:hypothetical protein